MARTSWAKGLADSMMVPPAGEDPKLHRRTCVESMVRLLGGDEFVSLQEAVELEVALQLFLEGCVH